MDAAKPLLSLRGITKSFPAVLANDHIDLDIMGGEIHALLGENGAGKSTLMKILYGYYRADSGDILLNGRKIQISSPHDARKYNIGMVFQDFILIPALTVAENIALFLPDLPFVLDEGEVARRIEEVSKRYGLQVNPRALVWQLSVGERQKVELLKLLLADARVLILDEPTRSLAPHEVEGLFRVCDNLRRDNYAVVLITHKMRDVLENADRITVMRRGRITGTLAGSEATEERLISLMFQTALSESFTRRTQVSGARMEPLLALKGVSTRAEGLSVGLSDINLEIYPGEIVGVAGVSGNGQKNLGDVLLGLERISQGSRYVMGQEASQWSVAKIREKGVAFIPEDPMGMAGFYWLSVQENMAMGFLSKYVRRCGLSLDWQAVRADLQASLKRLAFTLPSFFIPLGLLSGGNVQRMILAREMAHDPKVIIAFYPTRGLDVQSAIAARKILLASRDRGAGILLISEDLSELFNMSDRLVVMYQGRIVGESTPQSITPKDIGYLMTGSKGADGSHG